MMLFQELKSAKCLFGGQKMRNPRIQARVTSGSLESFAAFAKCAAACVCSSEAVVGFAALEALRA